jgi:hypothetical protein
MTGARITGASASLMIHVACFVALVIQAPAPAQEQSTPVAAERDGDDRDMQLLPTPETDGDGLACEGSYRGIGIRHWPNGEVVEVVAGGPAERAGMKVGDYLLSDALLQRDQYELGHRIPVRVDRDGKQLSLLVYVGRICYSAPHTVPHLRENP